MCSCLLSLPLNDPCLRVLSRVRCRKKENLPFWVIWPFQMSPDERINFQMCTSIQENYVLPPEQRMDLEVQL